MWNYKSLQKPLIKQSLHSLFLRGAMVQSIVKGSVYD